MDYWTALRVLGLEEDGLTRDRARRSYMRQLRQHPPEKDPEGFRRLREAFEAVRDGLPEDEEAAPPKVEPVRIIEEKLEAPPEKLEEKFEEKLEEKFEEKLEETIEPPRIDVRASLPPIAPPVLPERLENVMPRLCALLEKGEIEAAIALEEKWRAEADDFRQTNPLLVVRWQLVRELLGVARDLPLEVVKHLAYGLQLGDLSAARPRLIDYRMAHEKEAGEASTVLAMRASSLASQVEGTLWVPRNIGLNMDQLFPNQKLFDDLRARLNQKPKRSQTGSGVVIGGLMVLGVLARLMVAATSPSTPTPSYRPYQPLKIPEFHYQPLPQLSNEAFFIPPHFPALQRIDDTDATRMAAITESLQALQKFEITSMQQKIVAAEMELFVEKHDCRGMKRTLKQFEGLPGSEHEARRIYADMHLRAIQERVPLVCPDKKKHK